ncbi:MAG: hypothetical protein M3N43_02085 [Actinomycetota bacterium]|nr:hypothetical protein [Actinomycetota bacterium]
MKRFSRIAILLMVLGASAALLVTPVLATESTEETEAPTETEETVPVTSDIEPAVPVTTPAATEAPLDWTYRYMIPTAIVLGVLVVVVTTIQYFTSVVRKRYRIVKE